MTLRRIALTLFMAAAASGCTDQAPVSGPGTMTVTLRSPNGDEGAALVSLLGNDVGAVSASGVTEVHSLAGNSVTRIVLIDQSGGELMFRVGVEDTTNPPGWVIDEVAGPDDATRILTGYTLDFRR
jgi:hypothetical protein